MKRRSRTASSGPNLSRKVRSLVKIKRSLLTCIRNRGAVLLETLQSTKKEIRSNSVRQKKKETRVAQRRRGYERMVIRPGYHNTEKLDKTGSTFAPPTHDHEQTDEPPHTFLHHQTPTSKHSPLLAPFCSSRLLISPAHHRCHSSWFFPLTSLSSGSRLSIICTTTSSAV